MNRTMRRAALGVALSAVLSTAYADNTPQTLPFSQDWTNTGLITANDSWSGVPGIEGFLGQDITTATGADPRTLLTSSTVAGDLTVLANQTSQTITNGDVIEFQIVDPVVGLQGSGTADAPHVVFNINTLGKTGINVAYLLRDVDTSADNAIQPVALQYRIGTTGTWVNVPAGYVADASTGPSLATQATPVSAELPADANNQTHVQVRVITANAVGSDESVGVDNISITNSGTTGAITLSILDAAATNEGDTGLTTSNPFIVRLSAPAPAGGVSFQAATRDGTASSASDYVARTVSGTIAAGATDASLTVQINGDTTFEANETFFVDVTNVVGADVADGTALGTILNDDVRPLTAIHDVQGAGATSPLVGQAVDIEGIVTGRKSNGFYVQSPDLEADANPATSQGLFVFTTNAGFLGAANVGNRVRVSGNVVEFIPSQDPGQLPLTQISGVAAVVSQSVGNALPTPVALTTTFPSPTGPIDQLERLEGMRVAANVTVAGPTQGNTNEPTATGTSSGILHAVVTGVPRPFREPGIQAPDGVPAGSSIPPIPRWDFNPELFTVDTDGIAGAGSELDLAAGAQIQNLVGPLDYGFRRYTIMRDPAQPVTLVAGPTLAAARLPSADEFIVGSYNLERFFDTVNDPAIGEPVLTPTAYQKRLGKASAAIRDFLNLPDILGIVEIENLTTLQDVATRVNNDVVAAGGTNPAYFAYLVDGNDVGGIDVGFMIKTAPVAGATPRVQVLQTVQIGKDTTWIDPSSNQPQLLNDRPPLRVDAVVHYADGRSFPVTTVVVHQRSLNGANSTAPGGLTTEGDRVRRKRQAQAEFLANELQAMQTADPTRRIVVVGDFNAFEFNDGLGDSMNTTIGLPTPNDQTVVPNDGVDLVNPDFDNLAELESPEQRYSFTFGGNAQSLDHVIANMALLSASSGTSLDHARINADFPEVSRNTDGPARLSDHDPAIAYFTAAPLLADLSVDATAATPTVAFGQTARFDVRVTHDGATAGQGGDPARFPGVGFALDFAAPDAQITAPAGWTCDVPVVSEASTSAACANMTAMTSGQTADFAISAVAPAARAGGTLTLVASATSETRDPQPADNSDSASVAVAGGADMAVSINNLGMRGQVASFGVPVSNNGSEAAVNARLVILSPAPPSYVTLSVPTGWTCVRAATTTYRADCARSGLMAASTQQVFGFGIVQPRTAPGSVPLAFNVRVSSDAPDPQAGNNEASFSR